LEEIGLKRIKDYNHVRNSIYKLYILISLKKDVNIMVELFIDNYNSLEKENKLYNTENIEKNNGLPKYSLPDSGKRRKFITGSVRDIRTGKGRYDLISPFALKALAIRLEEGMTKYGERNWEKGQLLMSYLDSTMRHIQTFIMEEMVGREHEEDHISAAFWNLHSFIHTLEMIKRGLLPKELKDFPRIDMLIKEEIA